MDKKNKFLNKHQNPAILAKILLLVFAISLISLTYSCLNSNFERTEDGSFLISGSCIPFVFGNFYYLIGLIFLVIFFIYFSKDNFLKIPLYFSEFLLIIFGVYGLTIIQKAVSSTISWKFVVLNLILIFIISAILLDLREIFKDILEEE